MILDWKCPNCEENHISRIIEINIGDTFSLKCSNCNIYIDFEVKEKKYFLTSKCGESQNGAVAWK